jgi:hypothetical protein
VRNNQARSRGEDGIRVDAIGVIEVRDITRLTESVDTERNDAMASDPANPRKRRWVRIDDGYEAGVDWYLP